MLHTSILLYGFTAILGRMIELDGITLVVYRMGITLISLFFIPGILQKFKAVPPALRWKIAGIGVLLALHWVTFFEAIKQANVSICLSGMAATAFFTSLIEPIYFKRRIQWYELTLAAMVILGFGFIFGFVDAKFLPGLMIALVSAFIIAFTGVINKEIVEQRVDVFVIVLIEFMAGVSMLLLIFPFYWLFRPDTPLFPSPIDWFWLLILALGCTTLAYTLTMKSLEQVSAFTVSLSINLEPIYGMLMAWWFFAENEELNSGFYLGAAVILLSIFLHPLLRKSKSEDSSPPLPTDQRSKTDMRN